MPELAETKRGRPRQYRLQALPHFASPEVGFAAAALDELRERVVDQIADLSTETLAYVPEGTTLSIAALVVHLVWAEAGWIERVTGVSAPADLRAQIDGVGRAVPAGRRASLSMAAPELVALCRRVRDALTVPALAQLRDPTVVIPDGNETLTARGVLMHLIWHWTYHSGHIGLLAELAGRGYVWTFGEL